jgi:hypothetical protein
MIQLLRCQMLLWPQHNTSQATAPATRAQQQQPCRKIKHSNNFTLLPQEACPICAVPCCAFADPLLHIPLHLVTDTCVAIAAAAAVACCR